MSESKDAHHSTAVHLQWGVKIPLRDGTQLSASLYLPSGKTAAAPCLLAVTPYTVQRNHLRASYFAAHGYPFVVVDVRGRGNSEGVFRPFIQEAHDGYDVVEWLAQQPYCNGQVGLFSGSYEGYAQWAIAKEFPPHLATMVPGMAAVPGFDFPIRSNIGYPYVMQWLTYVTDRTAQESIFTDQTFWRGKFREWHESGRPLRALDAMVGNPSQIFQEWLDHPMQDAYWSAMQPAPAQFARLDLPILTLTGSYDSNQPGALYHYRQHLRNASPEAAAKHYLVIGPWDHSSVFAPKTEFAGLRFGAAAALDTLNLQLQWYEWVLRGGPKPEFLRKRVAYYVMAAEKWRYADSLEAITARHLTLYLHSSGRAGSVFESGTLSTSAPAQSAPDSYVYDPRDTSLAELESSVDPESRTDHRMVYARAGRQLVYHSMPFDRDTEISGFFRLDVWFSIDQPDTDFHAAVYEIGLDGAAIQLTGDCLRARHRESPSEQQLVSTTVPLSYRFGRFMFVSRRVSKGHRLRLVIGPINSIYREKNYNSGGRVADESISDARTVTVTLFHDESRPSALQVPLAQPEN